MEIGGNSIIMPCASRHRGFRRWGLKTAFNEGAKESIH